MITDCRDLALLGELTDPDADLFRLACQTLLTRSFVMRGTESSDALWDFAIRNVRVLEAWFSCAGISLKRDEILGVISIRPVPAMRARLGKEETCALLVARLLFEEKRAELSLSRFPSVSLFDLAQRYRAVIGVSLKKTRLMEILRSFSRWRLIEAQGELDDPETALVLFPSIAMTLDQAGIDEILEAVRDKGRAGIAEATVVDAEPDEVPTEPDGPEGDEE